jgi:hypothetical protein
MVVDRVGWCLRRSIVGKLGPNNQLQQTAAAMLVFRSSTDRRAATADELFRSAFGAARTVRRESSYGGMSPSPTAERTVIDGFVEPP